MTKQRKSTNNRSPAVNFYSVGLVESNGVFKVVDSFEFKRVNQFARNWQRTDSRDLARNLNKGKLVIK